MCLKMFFFSVFRTFSVFSFGSQALGRVASLVPDFKKAGNNVKLIFATLDRETKSDPNEGEFLEEPFDGGVDFRNVYFSYPTRSTNRILRVMVQLDSISPSVFLPSKFQ